LFQLFAGRIKSGDRIDFDWREAIGAAGASEGFAVGEERFAGGNDHAALGPKNAIVAAIRDIHQEWMIKSNGACAVNLEIRVMVGDEGIGSRGGLEFSGVANSARNDGVRKNGARADGNGFFDQRLKLPVGWGSRFRLVQKMSGRGCAMAEIEGRDCYQQYHWYEGQEHSEENFRQMCETIVESGYGQPSIPRGR